MASLSERSACDSQRSVIGWVTKMYYFELLRASDGMLSCWSRLPLLTLLDYADSLWFQGG
jgi:hypothetical protein